MTKSEKIEYAIQESNKKSSQAKAETTHGFNMDGFMEFLSTIGYETEDGNREFEMVKKIIQYGLNRKMVFKDEFCDWVSSMIPGVGFFDVAKFMRKGRLSNETIEKLEKYKKFVA